MKTLLLCFTLLAAVTVKGQSYTSFGNLAPDSCLTAACDQPADIRQYGAITNMQVIPNVAESSINLILTLRDYTYITIRLYNITNAGQIYTLFQGNMDPGNYNLNLQLPPVNDGSYELVAENTREQKSTRFMIQR